jgi:DNA replication protein DnaC
MNEELAANLKRLRLGGLLAHWDEYLQWAAQKRLSHGRWLEYVVREECRLKHEHARTLRLRRARIPEHLVMETFPFERQPKLDKKKILALYDGFDFMQGTQNVILLGPTGCGKTGLATSFLIRAIDRGRRGRHILFAELVDALYRAVADHSEARVLKQFLDWDYLLIDELGYVEVEPVQVGLFFTLMQRRHKKKPTLLTSNLGFSEWGTFLKNDQLTAALIDRLTENSHVINMKHCHSLRAKLNQEA